MSLEYDALIKYAVLNLRMTDLVAYLKGAHDKSEAYIKMETLSNLRKQLFENKVLWPEDQREGMWVSVVDEYRALHDSLPGSSKQYEFRLPGRDDLRESIESLVAQGDTDGAKKNVDIYRKKYPSDAWGFDMVKKLRNPK